MQGDKDGDVTRCDAIIKDAMSWIVKVKRSAKESGEEPESIPC